MANITRRGNSFFIRCSSGYDATGKQIVKRMSWKIPDGMTEKKAEKEANIQAAKFEERVRNGLVADSRMKFSSFAEKWFSDYADLQLRPRTVATYRNLMDRIIPEFGHMYIDSIRPQHLMDFYKSLGQTQKATSYRFKQDFGTYLSKRNMAQIVLVSLSGISRNAMFALSQGRCISKNSAEKIAKALGMSFSTLFMPGSEETISSSMVLHYHRMLSSMLHTAVEWQLIPTNPAQRVQPPKVQKKAVPYLDDKQAVHLLELLENAPIQYRTAVETLLFTGMRRGELLGLKWQDIDFSNNTINICRSLLYLPEKGIFEDETKNETSQRVIKVAKSAMRSLAAYQKWQYQQHLLLGSAWKNSAYAFVMQDGSLIRPDTLTSWFHDFIKETDLPQIHLHSLRHTNATLQIANGVSLTTVAGNLGHANASTTTKVYAHAIQSAAAASAEMMDNLLTPVQKKAL